MVTVATSDLCHVDVGLEGLHLPVYCERKNKKAEATDCVVCACVYACMCVCVYVCMCVCVYVCARWFGSRGGLSVLYNSGLMIMSGVVCACVYACMCVRDGLEAVVD